MGCCRRPTRMCSPGSSTSCTPSTRQAVIGEVVSDQPRHREPVPQRVAVVGGGIGGLAAALAVRRGRPDVEVVILEAADRIGGKLASADIAGVRVDVGAEALLCRRPEGLDLIDSVGLREHVVQDRKSTRLNSSHVSISYAVFCLKKKN